MNFFVGAGRDRVQLVTSDHLGGTVVPDGSLPAVFPTSIARAVRVATTDHGLQPLPLPPQAQRHPHSDTHITFLDPE